jgi:hypothetical protein
LGVEGDGPEEFFGGAAAAGGAAAGGAAEGGGVVGRELVARIRLFEVCDSLLRCVYRVVESGGAHTGRMELEVFLEIGVA